jgi:hypothetical protein
VAKKLYEVLAIESQHKTQAQTTRTELRTTFEKKRHLFEEKRRTFQPAEEGAPPIVEEQSDIQTSIEQELRWLTALWSKAIDTSYAVAEGNTRARADVVLEDGTVLLSAVPGIALLELQKRAGELHELLAAVPTLDPAKGFKPDEDKGPGVYRARDVTKTRTKKVERFVTVAAATEQHPAQIAKVTEDIAVGTIVEQEWSALVTPARKSLLLERSDELQRAIKAALQRANAVDLPAELSECGRKLFEYVLR